VHHAWSITISIETGSWQPNAQGIRVMHGIARLSNVTIGVAGTGFAEHSGIYLLDSTAKVRNSEIDVVNTTGWDYGIQARTSTVTITDTTINANSFGVASLGPGAKMQVDRSTVYGGYRYIFQGGGGSVFAAYSKIYGGLQTLQVGTSDPTCIGVYDDTYRAANSACQYPPP
jgi:hypothetical protein